MAQTFAPSESHAAVPLLETKLRRPTGTSFQVARPRLFQQLTASADRRLILVSAPAGYGKTALVSGWLAACGTPYAWLSLDEHDDDLESFLVYLVAAVRTAWSHALDDFALLLNMPTLLPPHRLADALLQGLLALPGPLILALDDYHTITAPAIHALMVRLVEHLPAHVHLVLMTRADPPLPMERLRGRQAVGEIRAADLRFSSEETRLLLQQLLGPQMSPEMLKRPPPCWRTARRVGRWAPPGGTFPARPARPSRLCPQDRPTRPRDHHGIPAVRSAGGAARGPARHACCGPRSLTASVPRCSTRPRRTKGARREKKGLTAMPLSAAIRRANLFVVALDEEGTWFRYHHFFQALLRVRLAQDATPAEIKAIHARAARWFGAQGLVDEAVVHALQAGDEAAAASLVEAQVHAALDREDWRQLDRLLGLLPAAVSNRPRLILAQAWLHFFRWQFGALAARLDAAEHALDAVPPAEPDQSGTPIPAQRPRSAAKSASCVPPSPAHRAAARRRYSWPRQPSLRSGPICTLRSAWRSSTISGACRPAATTTAPSNLPTGSSSSTAGRPMS